jgi:hypothetical protein
MYARETWVLAKGNEWALNTWERRTMRKIYGPINEGGQWRISTNAEPQELCGEQDLVALSKKGRLRWLGHGFTMPWREGNRELRKNLCDQGDKNSSRQCLGALDVPELGWAFRCLYLLALCNLSVVHLFCYTGVHFSISLSKGATLNLLQWWQQQKIHDIKRRMRKYETAYCLVRVKEICNFLWFICFRSCWLALEAILIFNVSYCFAVFLLFFSDFILSYSKLLSWRFVYQEVASTIQPLPRR